MTEYLRLLRIKIRKIRKEYGHDVAAYPRQVRNQYEYYVQALETSQRRFPFHVIDREGKIRYGRIQKAVCAKGNLCQNIYLFFRGYRKHYTGFGWCMMKGGYE